MVNEVPGIVVILEVREHEKLVRRGERRKLERAHCGRGKEKMASEGVMNKCILLFSG